MTTSRRELGRVCAYQSEGTCQEIYLYNAQTGSLACASCNPTGAAPTGQASFRPSSGFHMQTYRQRNLTEDGAVVLRQQ